MGKALALSISLTIPDEDENRITDQGNYERSCRVQL